SIPLCDNALANHCTCLSFLFTHTLARDCSRDEHFVIEPNLLERVAYSCQRPFERSLISRSAPSSPITPRILGVCLCLITSCPSPLLSSSLAHCFDRPFVNSNN